MSDAIVLQGVTKRFGSTAALDGLDLTVRRGEVHAFLGPNGAGKTTTLRVILGLLHADAGRLDVLGLDPWRQGPSLHRRLAYVPGDVSLWPSLSGGEVIDLLGRLRGGIDPARRDALIAQFDLDPRKRSRTYSKGNRQKVALISALASDVELYLLDEPTSGLDPIMESTFREVVRGLIVEGRTILLSSHILSEAEALADRVSIIKDGRIVESGSLAELRHLTRTVVTVRTQRPVEGLAALDGVHSVTVHDGTTSAEVDSSAMGAFIAAASIAGVLSLESHPPTLEDLFLSHYSRPS